MAGKSFSVNNAAAASITFNPTITLKDGVQYIDSSSSLSAPRLCVVKHTIPDTKTALVSDRHYVQFSKTLYDANGQPFTAKVATTVDIPRTVVSSADVADLRAFVKNLLASDTIWNGLVVGDY